jgi:hypothetical protein
MYTIRLPQNIEKDKEQTVEISEVDKGILFKRSFCKASWKCMPPLNLLHQY